MLGIEKVAVLIVVVDVDVVVIVIMFKNIILFLPLIIHQIKRKKERMRTMKQLGKFVFDVVEEVIMHVIVVLSNTWLSFKGITKEEREKS